MTTNAVQLALTWLEDHPRVRDVVYLVALVAALLCAAGVWLLPLFDVDHVGRIDVDELAKVSIVTGAAAAGLAKLMPKTKPKSK